MLEHYIYEEGNPEPFPTDDFLRTDVVLTYVGYALFWLFVDSAAEPCT